MYGKMSRRWVGDQQKKEKKMGKSQLFVDSRLSNCHFLVYVVVVENIKKNDSHIVFDQFVLRAR